MIETQCRCGAIALRIAGDPIAQVYCHCSDCQCAHSAAYALNAVYPTQAVTITQGDPASSAVKNTPRLRCPSCGTHLFTEIESAGLRSVNAYLLPVGTFVPQCHIHCADAVLPVVDELPHYKTLPESFGGSGEHVAW